MRWHAGEQLRLRISSTPLTPPALPGLPEPAAQQGKKHLIHTGKNNPLRLTFKRCDAD